MCTLIQWEILFGSGTLGEPESTQVKPHLSIDSVGLEDA